MASAPASARRCTSAVSSSAPPVRVESWPSEVTIRGPGTVPRATASRTGPSTAEPRLWTVVKPASSIRMPFSTACRAAVSGAAPRASLPSSPKCQSRWTWVSIRPGRIVPPGKSRRWPAGRSAAAATATIRPSRTTTPWFSRTPPRPSSTRSAVSTTVPSSAAYRDSRHHPRRRPRRARQQSTHRIDERRECPVIVARSVRAGRHPPEIPWRIDPSILLRVEGCGVSVRQTPVGATELASRRATNRSRIAVRADIALAYPA